MKNFPSFFKVGKPFVSRWRIGGGIKGGISLLLFSPEPNSLEMHFSADFPPLLLPISEALFLLPRFPPSSLRRKCFVSKHFSAVFFRTFSPPFWLFAFSQFFHFGSFFKKSKTTIFAHFGNGGKIRISPFSPINGMLLPLVFFKKKAKAPILFLFCTKEICCCCFLMGTFSSRN